MLLNSLGNELERKLLLLYAMISNSAGAFIFLSFLMFLIFFLSNILKFENSKRVKTV